MVVHAALVAGLALGGLALGWPQRALIAGLTGPAEDGAPRARDVPAGLVGVTSAVVLGALAARVHPALVLLAACALAAGAVPLGFIDVAVQRLPDVLTAAAYAATAAFLLLAAAAGAGRWSDMARAALGGLALAGVYFALLLISPSGMGLGDVKLAASLGTLLAWFGWRLLVLGGFAGFLLAAVYSIVLLAAGRATRKQHIPFGPFMIAGTFLAVLAWPMAGLARPQAVAGQADELGDRLVVGGRAAQPPVGQRAEQQVEGQRGVGVGADLAARGGPLDHDVQGLEARLEVPVTHLGHEALVGGQVGGHDGHEAFHRTLAAGRVLP